MAFWISTHNCSEAEKPYQTRTLDRKLNSFENNRITKSILQLLFELAMFNVWKRFSQTVEWLNAEQFSAAHLLRMT